MSSLAYLRNRIANLLGKSHSGNRDLYKTFGYKTQLEAEDFYALYLRNDIAQRVIKAYPKATWRDSPNVAVEGDNNFEEQFEELYKEHKLSHYFDRADTLSQIGHYGLLVLGFQDGKNLSEPLLEGGQVQKNADLAYVAPYAEYNITVQEWNMNENSPRFRLPEYYTIQTGNPNLGKSSQTKSIRVHHSRTIHIAERLDEDEVYGVPMLMSTYNRFKDLEKVVGGSAEMFWLAANRGLVFNADADADFTEDAKDDMKDQIEDYMHELRRTLTAQGGEFDVLGSETADPSKHVDVFVDLISGATGIPKRILMGNEAGELASSQDETNWNARVDERRMTFAAPMIVRPFIEKMQLTGNLPQVEGEIEIDWDEADALDEETIATIQKTRAETIDRLNRAIPNLPVKQLVKVFYPEKSEDEIEDIIAEVNEQPPITQP